MVPSSPARQARAADARLALSSLPTPHMQTAAITAHRKDAALRSKRLRRDASAASLGISREPSKASLGALRRAPGTHGRQALLVPPPLRRRHPSGPRASCVQARRACQRRRKRGWSSQRRCPWCRKTSGPGLKRWLTP